MPLFSLQSMVADHLRMQRGARPRMHERATCQSLHDLNLSPTDPLRTLPLLQQGEHGQDEPHPHRAAACAAGCVAPPAVGSWARCSAQACNMRYACLCCCWLFPARIMYSPPYPLPQLLLCRAACHQEPRQPHE